MIARVASAAIMACVVIAGCGSPASRPATVEIANVGSVAVVAAGAPRSSARAAQAAATEIAWMSSERDARERARRLGLPLVVWARAEWAAAALEMERKSWADAQVVRAAGAFVALRLDLTDAEGDAELLAQKYAVDTLPLTILFDASGRKVAVLRGYIDAAALAQALAQAAS